MSFSFEINDNENSVIFKNLDLDLLNEITKEDNIKEILQVKWYKYATYDKLEIIGNLFMVLKSSKKIVVLLNVK
jgi:hypothetical protein